jgi:excisionase family DNA binding protein
VADAFDALIDRLADRLVDAVLVKLDQRLGHDLPPGQQPDAYRTAEVATVLRLSRREVQRLTASGELRSVRVGRARLVPREAVAEFLARRSLRTVA